MGNPLELTRARHISARFVGLTIQADAMVKREREGPDFTGMRKKRNIFGSILGGLTGLVTSEQMEAEQEKQRELEKKLMHALEQEVALDGQLDGLATHLEGFEDKILREMDQMRVRFGTEDHYRAKQGGGGNAVPL